jgi:hypothetical protein
MISTTSNAMPRQLRQLFSGKIVEIEVPEVRALRHPDETLAIRQKARRSSRSPMRPAALSRTTLRHLPDRRREQAARS